MKTCLVVYYSRTGITQEVAQRIAAGCACESERIVDTRARRGVIGYLQCGYEALAHATPPIAPATRDPGDYALVILGSPVWAGRLASPMRSYLHAHAGRLHAVAAFCTMGGSGGEAVLDEIAALCGKPLVACMALADGDIRSGHDHERIGQFIRTTAAAAAAAPERPAPWTGAPWRAAEQAQGRTST